MKKIPSLNLQDFLSEDQQKKSNFVKYIGSAFQDICFCSFSTKTNLRYSHLLASRSQQQVGRGFAERGSPKCRGQRVRFGLVFSLTGEVARVKGPTRRVTRVPLPDVHATCCWEAAVFKESGANTFIVQICDCRNPI